MTPTTERDGEDSGIIRKYLGLNGMRYRRRKSTAAETKLEKTGPSTPGLVANQGLGWKLSLLWLSGVTVLSATLYRSEALTLVSQVGNILDGSSYQAYQLAGLLFVGVFLLLRGRDLADAFGGKEKTGSKTRTVTRILGLFLILTPVVFSADAEGSLTLSAVILLVAWYGMSLVVNPNTVRFLAPYLGLALGATVAPQLVQPVVGQPLADLATAMIRPLVWALRVPVAWQGSALQFTALNGSVVSASITALCSSVSSITLFLLLLGLMQLDLKVGLRQVLMLAVVGTALLPIVNAVRITATILIGYTQGAEAFLSVHKWIDYPVFFGFYCLAAAYLMSRARVSDVSGRATFGQVV